MKLTFPGRVAVREVLPTIWSRGNQCWSGAPDRSIQYSRQADRAIIMAAKINLSFHKHEIVICTLSNSVFLSRAVPNEYTNRQTDKHLWNIINYCAGDNNQVSVRLSCTLLFYFILFIFCSSINPLVSEWQKWTAILSVFPWLRCNFYVHWSTMKHWKVTER